MFKNKKVQAISSFALSSALIIGGIFTTSFKAYASSLTNDQKSQFESAYFDNSVSNKASKKILKEYPNLAKNIEADLEKLIKESDAILVKSEHTMENIYPERANESDEIKALDKAVFNNRIEQESIYLLFDLTPKKVEKSKDKFVKELNEAIVLSNRGEYQLSKARGIKKISIVHVNDTHGRVEENEKNEELGFAKLKTFYDGKNVDNNALLLNAGDVVHGTTFATISRGESVIDVMNKMGFDAMVAGNHDFNYGYEQLVSLNKRANFPILAANVIDDSSQSPIIDSDKLIELNGVKIGIFGLATDETKTKSAPANTEGLTFVNSEETAKAEVEKLKNQGADLIVCLSHLGVDKESQITSELIASKVSDIDVIIDGHSHTKLENGKAIGDSLIAQSESYGRYIGEVSIDLDKDNKIISKQAKLNPYKRTKYLNADKSIQEEIKKVTDENDLVLKEKVGQTNVKLEGSREKVRSSETNLGDFVADAMIKVTGADIAITNGGGIRDSIEKGDITKENVLNVFPFTNYAVTMEVPGSVIRKALEHGLADAPNTAGKFPQTAGMIVKYDTSKAAGNRVIEITIDGKPIDDDKIYTLATNDFLSTGGDGYEMLKSYDIKSEYELISEIFEKAIKDTKNINSEIDNRMQDISGSDVNKKAA
ncbi:bifunctional UDP-sugar hydrolase/5'-nucleotidase [uncultured Anaerococcus sp.]|uniref:bifunctional metallophosphatase/5'-nucleotidase n=1 Tax=uncultured Anaerococcus sp. TaxID=293428 RepID=UPI0026027B2D|nr:bifunctional UDP-sugar hydrolase/5'-nucleotidase [uncultured Anaerococcus sp.]